MTAPARQTTVVIEVPAHLATDPFHCRHCEQVFGIAGIGATVPAEIQTSHPAWILEETARLAALLEDLLDRYGEKLHVRIMDVGSVEGRARSLRCRMRRHQAFIINRRAGITGWETAALKRQVRDAVDGAESA